MRNAVFVTKFMTWCIGVALVLTAKIILQNSKKLQNSQREPFENQKNSPKNFDSAINCEVCQNFSLTG
jgi:hypothetical protein